MYEISKPSIYNSSVIRYNTKSVTNERTDDGLMDIQVKSNTPPQLLRSFFFFWGGGIIKFNIIYINCLEKKGTAVDKEPICVIFKF